MNILCICPIGIGNYLLCYPAWAALKKQLPHATLHLLALRKQITDLASTDPLWEEIHFIEPTKKPSLKAQINFITTLRSFRFAAALSFFPSNTWQYNTLPWLAGCKKRYAFNYQKKRLLSLSFLATHRLPVDGSLHDVTQNMALTAFFTHTSSEQLGVPVFPDLITENDSIKARTLLPPGRRYFAMHPGSSAEHGMDAKRWAPERFGELADRICKHLNATALLFGGPDEHDLKNATAAAMTISPIIIDPQPLSVTASLLKETLFCLCNDSGIMHLAACGGTPVAALFGPTDEKRNGPYGDNHCILRKTMEGFPLWTAANVGVRHVPRGIDPNKSLNSLSVDEAWTIILPFLELLH